MEGECAKLLLGDLTATLQSRSKAEYRRIYITPRPHFSLFRPMHVLMGDLWEICVSNTMLHIVSDHSVTSRTLLPVISMVPPGGPKSIGLVGGIYVGYAS
jgi:hypothetical protein